MGSGRKASWHSTIVKGADGAAEGASVPPEEGQTEGPLSRGARPSPGGGLDKGDVGGRGGGDVGGGGGGSTQSVLISPLYSNGT